MTPSKSIVPAHTEIARPLNVLVPLIREELERGDAAGIEHYRQAGEMLLEAREQIDGREWSGWLDRHFHLSRSTAVRYMKLAEFAETKSVRRRTLSEIVEPERESHQPSWHAPVREITNRVDVNRLALERQNKEKELRIMRDLASRLIAIGYRVLAAKLHPDRGGSQEAMARLNRVREILKRAV